MATRQSTIDGLLDQIADAGTVVARKMFGEYCLYLDGKPVALVCRDLLYVKPTPAGRDLSLHEAEESPFPGIRPYLLISTDQADHWSFREALCHLLRSTFDALPVQEPRPRRGSSRKSQNDRPDSADRDR